MGISKFSPSSLHQKEHPLSNHTDIATHLWLCSNSFIDFSLTSTDSSYSNSSKMRMYPSSKNVKLYRNVIFI